LDVTEECTVSWYYAVNLIVFPETYPHAITLQSEKRDGASEWVRKARVRHERKGTA